MPRETYDVNSEIQAALDAYYAGLTDAAETRYKNYKISEDNLKAMMNGLAAIPADKKVVVYCYSYQTAGQSTAALKLLGYDAVSLNGGMGVEVIDPNGWTNKGYDVTAE